MDKKLVITMNGLLGMCVLIEYLSIFSVFTLKLCMKISEQEKWYSGPLIEVFECQLVVLAEFGLELHFGKNTATYEPVGTIYSVQASSTSNNKL